MEQLPPPPVPLRPDLAPTELEVPRRRRRFPVWVTVRLRAPRRQHGGDEIGPVFGGMEDPRGPGFPVPGSDRPGDPDPVGPLRADPLRRECRLAPPGSIGRTPRGRRPCLGRHGDRFVYEGTTDEEASISRDVYQFDRYGDRWYRSSSHGWTPTSRTSRSNAAIASPPASLSPASPWTRPRGLYMSGWVAINADDPNPPGFSVSRPAGARDPPRVGPP